MWLSFKLYGKGVEFEMGRARLRQASETSLPLSFPPIYSSSRPFSNSLSVSRTTALKASPFLSPSLGEQEFVSSSRIAD